MTTFQMREALKGVYKSKAWAIKVDKMPESQVYAVFMNLRKQNKV